MGHEEPANNPKLRDDISTDEITPAHYWFFILTRRWARFLILGMKCGSVTPDWARRCERGGFVCSVSGKRARKGISREQSPYAEMCAGIRVGDCENIERILQQNA